MAYIDCKSIAERIESETKRLITYSPFLSVYFTEGDASAEFYYKSLKSCADRVGINIKSISFNKNISFDRLKRITMLDDADGIMILSEPPHLYDVRNHLGSRNIEGDDHNDDVDKLFCTAKACYEVIKSIHSNIEGMNAVVVGYGKRVGKPLSYLLMRKHIGTVTMTHRYTSDLSNFTKNADIVISAVGRENMITSDMLKQGALVIDVGCSTNGRGDVCPLVSKEFRVTSVPGGIGPITTSLIMKNLALKVQ